MLNQRIMFQLGNPATFRVVVKNHSEKLAAFHLEILAATGNQEQEHNWFRLSPQVSTLQPPGDFTEFRVEILASPIPHFVGDINITVKVSSPQLLTARTLILRLTIEPTDEAPLLRVT
jgi:hypothetical protein